MTGDPLTDSLLGLVDEAQPRARNSAALPLLEDIRVRLRGPLRLAIAGKVKAGKSTLLNALLGEELAPTDAGECTRIVTWYHESHRPHVVLFTVEGPPRERPFRRDKGALRVDLAGTDPAEIDHLEIGWPTSRLNQLTLIDTPGIASISSEVSARTQQVLAADDGRVPVADAVLYLLRHTHASDMRFLESFHDDELAHGTPINAVGVLSRADEIGSCRLDAMEVADRVAHRYEAEPRLHRLCPLIVPVNGLLGYAAVTLREAEFASLASIAKAPPDQLAALLLTVDRFAAGESPIGVPGHVRAQLLERLGLYGVRLSVELIRSGAASTSTSLSEELRTRSGLDRLRRVLLHQFHARARLLKARSAISALEDLFQGDAFDDQYLLTGRLEEITAGAHELEEVRLLFDLRSDAISLREDRTEALDRLLGGSGHGAAVRLGLPEDARPDEIRAAAVAALATWHAVSEHPLSRRSAQIAARTATRTIEGLLAATHSAAAESG